MRIPLALAAFATAAISAPVSAQAPMDDCLWVAARTSRTLTQYSRFGQVLQTVDLTTNGYQLRGVFRAPDGKLWLVNFITDTFTLLDRNAKIIKNIKAQNSGSPYAIAFDKRGWAFIAHTGSNTVDEYQPDGTFSRSFNVPANPLGIAVDYSLPNQMGNVWVAHRNGPPGQVSKIDIQSGKVTSYTLPSASSMMPTRVVCTYEGVGNPSKIWVGGDGSGTLYQCDQNGNFSAPVTTSSGFTYPSGMAIDRNNDLWAVARNGTCVLIDGKTLQVKQQFTVAPNNNDCGGVVVDSIGRPWFMDRGFSTPGVFHRYSTTGMMELETPAGTNAYGMVDASGFSYAFVTNPFGDEDGDKVANFNEITNGTSPYDPLSTPNLSFDTRGVSRLGQTPYLDAVSATNGAMVVFFSAKTAPGLSIPGLNGQFLLDLPTLFFVDSFASPGQVKLPIPNVPAFAGISYQLQGLFVGSSFDFTNLSGIYVSK